MLVETHSAADAHTTFGTRARESTAVTDEGAYKIANKDAGCHACHGFPRRFGRHTEPLFAKKFVDQHGISVKLFGLALPELEAGSQKLGASSVTHTGPSEIANKDAGCNAVTHSRAHLLDAAFSRHSAGIPHYYRRESFLAAKVFIYFYSPFCQAFSVSSLCLWFPLILILLLVFLFAYSPCLLRDSVPRW